MIYIIIYIIGCFVAFASLLIRQIRTFNYIKLKDLITMMVCSIISWIGVLVILCILIEENWNTIIWRQKNED